MIVRIQGRDRIMSIEIEENSTIERLKEIINERTKSICTRLVLAGAELNSGTLLANGIGNGDMLQATYDVVRVDKAEDSPSTGNTGGKRECRHGPSGMCADCAPEDSWLSSSFDKRRFISQGAYEEYLASQGKELVLESHLPPACRNHPASGRCHLCLPKEIVLGRQTFRPVDHIEIDDRSILERLIHERRATGGQTVYLLVGRYSEYAAVSKGVKAEVFAALPVEHTGLINGVVLNPADKTLQGTDESLKKVLDMLGMEIVGMAYTRILPEPQLFVSSMEVLFVAEMQRRFPYIVSGQNKGSRFVTLVIAGTETSSETIEICGTNLAIELLQDGLLFAAANPREVKVAPATAVWTGKEGTKHGHEIPVEYLVVRPTHGLTAGEGLFAVPSGMTGFKRGSGLSGVKKHLQKRLTEESVQGLSLGAFADLGLLLELADLELLPDGLAAAVLARDGAAFNQDVLEGKYPGLVDLAKDCKLASGWGCQACTFQNTGNAAECDMCGLPRSC
ncbi:nuclear protein localization protein 4 [Nematocida homosporus]|uniref:nuclear protein localization protein 4 n=1 Tax=Nematocida homosporus TaxID=1912981 RepID=UPI002220F3A1|nr:nuclear protein localization protein 4 [Nematocida homosporus]KAI5185525.1 nuclear protein localization protein 4 [Nematocida homosporus]